MKIGLLAAATALSLGVGAAYADVGATYADVGATYANNEGNANRRSSWRLPRRPSRRSLRRL